MDAAALDKTECRQVVCGLAAYAILSVTMHSCQVESRVLFMKADRRMSQALINVSFSDTYTIISQTAERRPVKSRPISEVWP